MCHKSAKHNHSSRDLGKNTYYPATNTLIRMKLATLVLYVDHLSRLVTNLRTSINSYDVIHGHYSITWPPVYSASSVTVSCLALCFSLPVLCRKCVYLYKGPNPHSLAKVPVVSSSSIFYPQSLLIHWNFLPATHDCTLFVDRVMYLLSNLANQSLYYDLVHLHK
jgi:hypothetical protein